MWGWTRWERKGDPKDGLVNNDLNDRMRGWSFSLALCFICSFLVQEAALEAAKPGLRLLQALVPLSNAHEKPQVIRALQYSPALEKVSRTIKKWPESSTV